MEYRAVVLDNGGHTSVSQPRGGTVPAPVLTLAAPKEGSSVKGKVEVGATPDPEKAELHGAGSSAASAAATGRPSAQDSSSPAYTAVDDLGALDLADGTQVRYRALMDVPGVGKVASGTRTVVAGELPQPDSVTVAGSLNWEMGCPGDWQPACRAGLHDAGSGGQDLAAHRGPARRQLRIQGGHQRLLGRELRAGGALNGSNIVLDHAGGPVTFRYDNTTHLLSAVYASQQPGAVAAAGDMNSELGCAGDWMPDCDLAQLILDPDRPGLEADHHPAGRQLRVQGGPQPLLD